MYLAEFYELKPESSNVYFLKILRFILISVKYLISAASSFRGLMKLTHWLGLFLAFEIYHCPK